MKNTYSYLLGLCLATCLASCGDRARLDVVYDAAGINGIELKKVIDHYAEKAEDSLKLKAATFIIENMPNHGSFQSAAGEAFRKAVNSSDTVLAMDNFNKLWDSYNDQSKPNLKLDIKNINAKFLIRDIDKAFDTWRHVAWKNEIDFNLFCRYVLPYRIKTEMLAEGWRDTLYNRYYAYVKDAKTMKQAFETLHDVVREQTKRGTTDFPFVLDVVAMLKQEKAPCSHFCVKLGMVARAVGLPAVIDNVDFWANYSKNGHSWVAMVTKQGTYTIYADEHEARLDNKIDASQFKLEYPIPEDYPLMTHFEKRPPKVIRDSYEPCATEKIPDSKYWRELEMLKYPFRQDVSEIYGLHGKAEITTTEDVRQVYLCAYHTGHGWTPVAHSTAKNGKCRFEALANSVLYLPMTVAEGKRIAVGPPFFITGNEKRTIVADAHKRQSMRISRKYPLVGKILNYWAAITNSLFEASNDSTFATATTLHKIENVPFFKNVADISIEKPFRYVRYKSTQEHYTHIAEIEFYGKNGRLHLKPLKCNSIKYEQSVDGNTFTFAEIPENHYLAYDLGKEQVLTKIVYYPHNDDNFVSPGHKYDLYCFDQEWKKLKTAKATGYELVFNNMPCGALFILIDKTKGKESRPFTFENNKQIWW